jgi:hypothetical protein
MSLCPEIRSYDCENMTWPVNRPPSVCSVFAEQCIVIIYIDNNVRVYAHAQFIQRWARALPTRCHPRRLGVPFQACYLT